MVTGNGGMGSHSGDGGPGETQVSKKRTRIARPYPVHTLEEAMVVASAIHETNAGLPLDRVLLAKSLSTTPSSSGFMTKLNSSAKYGLTQGGYADERIALTPLGLAVIAPKRAEERPQALVEAALQPEVFRRFYELLDGKRLPEDVYAGNMIQQELEIKSSLTDECLRIVKANGVFVGVLGEVGGALYVSLSTEHALDEKLQRPASPRRKSRPKARAEEPARETPTPTQPPSPAAEAIGGTVFIGHAGSPDVAAFLKSALESFDIACGVAESDQADDRPISQGVSEQMRACDVAVLVFARPESGDKGEVSSQKMMCQLGAAWVLFEERVVALAESDLLHWGEQTGGLRVLEFHREKLGELGLALLAELRRIGVIDVRTAAA